MTPRKPAAAEPQPLRFEEALARLETIVQELEGEDLTLEETLARYEEGTRLVRECSRRLEDAEQRIRTLAAEDAGRESAPGEARDDVGVGRTAGSIEEGEDGEVGRGASGGGEAPNGEDEDGDSGLPF